MAIYHLSVQTISRGNGKSCIASAAYRAGEKLYDERQGIEQDYTKKQRVESEIIAPEKSPEWVHDRERLWNEVDRAETRCNSRTARELNVALPVELSREAQKETARQFVKENFVDKGMVADLCFHFNDSNNPHFHVMLTTREIDQEGFKNKNRQWDNKENVNVWRENWEKMANKALEREGLSERIDHRSYKEQGIDKIPTVHLGKTASEMMKKGIENPRAELNERIKKLNQEKVVALKEYKELKAEIEKERAAAERYKNITPEEKRYIERSESLIKKPLTLQNGDSALKTLRQMKDETCSKRSNLASKAREIDYKINYTLENLKRYNEALNEFKTLPKNLFGRYKDKDRAEVLQRDIKTCQQNMFRNGYGGMSGIEKAKAELAQVSEELRGTDGKINSIDSYINDIEKSIEALKNKEVREFRQEYKNIYPNIKYFGYNDMKAIQEANKIIGKTASPSEIKELAHQADENIESIIKEIRSIENNGERLKRAREAFETIDKTEGIAEKYDNKVLGKKKYQEEHFYDKLHYDSAVNTLAECNIKTKPELISQETAQYADEKKLPKLQVNRENLEGMADVLCNAVRTLSYASLEAQRDKVPHKTKEHTHSRGKGKGMDFER